MAFLKKQSKGLPINGVSHAQQMGEIQNSHTFSRRVILLMIAIIAGVGGLIGRAYYLQVFRHSYYRTRSEKNRVKSQVIPPLRGNIYDRNGLALSENILSYHLIVNRAKSPKPDELVKLLNQYMRFDETDLERYEADKRKKLFNQDVVVRSDLSEDEVNVLSVDLYRFPGFDIVPAYRRYYPYGNLTAHVVGYINNINKKDLQSLDMREYSGTTKVGRTGIEREYESQLHGQAGFRQAEFSRTGKIVRVLNQVDPVPGDDLYLSLDIKLQQIITQELETGGFEGAGVAINPQNGEVLAMCSNPGFDANLFVDGISHKDYKLLHDSPRKNLFNRALKGNYAPASTIKPIMALAGLNYYVVTPDINIRCTGSYRIPEYKSTKKFYCWKRAGGHGEMNVKSSIVQSCDVYYYTVGKELGIARIHEYLSQFGFGAKTGIDLPGESTGILPDKTWKQKRYNKGWFIGDTINASIGQGYLTVTPLQLAYSTAILAVKGKRYRPHLVTHVKKTLSDQKEKTSYAKMEDVVQRNPHAWDIIGHSMVDVMTGSQGTGRKVKVGLPFKIAGKTGTAQVFSFKNEKRIKKKDLKKKLRDNSVFISYAPADNPVIALAIILENAGGGSETAAPIATKILRRYFLQNEPDVTPDDGDPPQQKKQTNNTSSEDST